MPHGQFTNTRSTRSSRPFHFAANHDHGPGKTCTTCGFQFASHDHSMCYVRASPVPPLPKHCAEGGPDESAELEIAEADYVRMALDAEAMKIVAKAEAIFLERELERRAKETWLEEQQRLTTSMLASYGSNY